MTKCKSASDHWKQAAMHIQLPDCVGAKPECLRLVRELQARQIETGLEDNPYKTVHRLESVGRRNDFPENGRVISADKRRGRGPVGTAIHAGMVFAFLNTQTDPNFAQFRLPARHYGFSSVIAQPLIGEGHRLGALYAYAHEIGAFDASEQLLLRALADELALGIAMWLLRAERARLEHTRASKIAVTLKPWGNGVVLSVKDDGAGFPNYPTESGKGSINMRMRARLIGGRLEINRRNHGGTRVACKRAARLKVKHGYFKNERNNAC